jgi:hypothetical protein
MALTIVPYDSDHISAVRALNARLRAGGSPYTFPEDPIPAWLPPGTHPYQEYRVVMDGSHARGAYILKHERFILGGEETSLGCFQLPISEGITDRRYAAVALRLIRDALNIYPKLYSLGLGSLSEPVTRLLKGAGWSIAPVPFYFRVVHGKNFLHQLKYIRTSSWRRFALDGLAHSGLGPVGIQALHALKTRSAPREHTVAVRAFDTFESWADTVFSHNVSRLRCAAVRTSDALNRLYTAQPERFLRLLLMEENVVRGWVVMLVSQHTDHKHFGAMKLGSIVDGLSDPGYERNLLHMATRALQDADVDLIVTNQSWDVFGEALRNEGYLQAATNFFFAASPDLAGSLSPFEASIASSHLTRGDGDGPIHL